jgi:DeoR family transcriptional regulator, fructose operon transcriptional repressor
MKVNEEVKQQVIETLNAQGKLTVRQVTELLNISEVTTRRLFSRLEEEGRVIRTFGGIQRVETDRAAYSYNDSDRQKTQEKAAIGLRAAQEVESGDQVFLDSGTTVMAMARALASRIDTGELEGLRIVTNSLIVTDLLAERCKVILVGGEIRTERRDACGYLAEEFLKRLHMKKAFLGCDAFDLDNGLMTTDERTAHINEIVMKNVTQIFILADARKIGETSFVSYGSIEQVHTLITDESLASNYRDILATRLTRLLIAQIGA